MPSASGGRGSVPWTYAGSSAPRPPLWARAPSLAIAAHPSAPPTSNYFRRPAAARWHQPYAHKYYHRSLHPPILTVVYLDYTRASRFYIYSVHLFSGIRHTHTLATSRSCGHGIEYEDTWHDFVHAILPEIDFLHFLLCFFLYFLVFFSFRAVD